jgi:MFS family permease
MWVRKNVIALGLAAWSAMTALSGTAGRLLTLGAYRIGVGVGESSATPAAYSLLTDYFPERLRATALSLYAGGLYVGQGLGLFVGGWILDRWSAAFPGGEGWFGLRGWQAAFFVVGLPGLLLAVWVWTLREPVRGANEQGVGAGQNTDRPLRALLGELASVLPPFTLGSLRAGGASAVQLWGNVALGLALVLLAALLVRAVGAPEQWFALALGVYATLSWAQGLALRDPPSFALLFRCRALAYTILGVSASSFVTYAFMFWTAPLLLRKHGITPTEAGFFMLVANVAGGLLGVTLGGVTSDRLKRRTPNGRLYLITAAMVAHIPAGLLLLLTLSLPVAYAAVIAFNVASTAWVGSATAIVHELVLPRMRALGAAVLLLMYTFVGLALGPFAVGRLSDLFTAGGSTPGAALQSALTLGMIPLGLALLMLALATRHLPAAESTRLARARAAGEPC